VIGEHEVSDILGNDSGFGQRFQRHNFQVGDCAFELKVARPQSVDEFETTNLFNTVSRLRPRGSLVV
jgi:hypothetical protein